MYKANKGVVVAVVVLQHYKATMLTHGICKSQPNDRKISTQHIATCSAFLLPVVTCCDMLHVGVEKSI